jgi:hypothetical protein
MHDGVVTRESGCRDAFVIGDHGLGKLVFEVLKKGIGMLSTLPTTSGSITCSNVSFACSFLANLMAYSRA